ncbi:hypothetical protein AS156_28890 [Bradyrhizobium macuxiense]|uniref:Uncharacterized protein n=1 Tax=Bradyrhizobium macuxiense TaxID=1755647 RepID=A0A109K4G6_9BRAD|nr:hypothetical protein [Bradyrhizobium macuxiense]KWV60413.1 hypothetical protein AS156_28890 [Bradyrhizobium macuxiense]
MASEHEPLFEGWHPDIVDLVKSVDTLNKWGLFVRPSLATWSKGRVILLGDAFVRQRSMSRWAKSRSRAASDCDSTEA